VTPGFPAILTATVPGELSPPPAGAATSGYRRQLAEWLTRPDHPLTARVGVNRVWPQYFGRGVVATPHHLGPAGALPPHPELLDWLATEFIRSGWRLKSLHRLILTSSAYRQSSQVAAHGATAPADRTAVDPDNVLLWRMPLRRLESEIVRDSILAASGTLDLSIGGPPVPIKPLPDGMVVVETNLPAETTPFRRSMYLLSRRNYQPTELGVFDQPLLATNCTRRTSAAVALQSLTMLNGEFITGQADHFAKRVISLAGADESRQIALAFQLALSRLPSAEEV